MKSTKIIVEIGQAHEGSLGILHSYIDSVAKTGVDSIKFQTHIAEAESSRHEPFRVNFSYEDQTRYEYWKRMEFTEEQWVGIKDHCEEVGLEFLSSPFSVAAVELLERLGMTQWKIASGEVTNFLMLERIRQTGKPVMLSSGMSSFDELDQAVTFLKNGGCQVSVFQCTTSYPTTAEQVGLNVINELKERYQCKVGLSDHSGTIFPSLAAVTLGAELIEVHGVFHKEMFGPDTASSLTIEQIRQLCEGTRYIDTALSSKVNKQDNSEYSELKVMFGKSLAAGRDIGKGDEITINDLESKKPGGYGIPASDFRQILGKRSKRPIKQNEFIKYSDLCE